MDDWEYYENRQYFEGDWICKIEKSTCRIIWYSHPDIRALPINVRFAIEDLLFEEHCNRN